MEQNLMFLLVLWFLLLVSLIGLFYIFSKIKQGENKKRRKWARINVPNEKMITCKISEPLEYSSNSEFLINDINMAGIAFSSNREIKKKILKLLVKFPFTTFNEASTVWGKVIYCNKIGDTEKYRVGISYFRPNKRSR